MFGKNTIVARVGPIVIATLISQITSALGLFLMPLLGLHVSDFYSIALQTGYGAFTGIELGVVYSLAVGRPTFRHWRLFGNIAALFSIVLAVITGFLMSRGWHTALVLPWQSHSILACFGFGGAALSLAGNWAIREACNGRPIPLAGISIPCNICFLVAAGTVAFFFNSSPVGAVVPAISWATSNIVLLLVVRRSTAIRTSAVLISDVNDTRENKILHAAALVAGVVASTLMPAFFITAIAQLTPGLTTALFIIIRLGGSLVNLGVNSVLMATYNWMWHQDEHSRSFGIAMFGAFGFGVIAIVLKFLLNMPSLAYGFVIASWAISIVVAPIVLREINARRMGRIVMGQTAVDILALSVIALCLNRHPSATGYLAAYMTSQCITAASCGLALRDRTLLGASFATLVVSGVLIVHGWSDVTIRIHTPFRL